MLMSRRNLEWLEANGFEFKEEESWYSWKRTMGNGVVIDLALFKSDETYGELSVHDVGSGTMCNFPCQCFHSRKGHVEKAIERALDYAKGRLVDSLVRHESVRKELLEPSCKGV